MRLAFRKGFDPRRLTWGWMQAPLSSHIISGTSGKPPLQYEQIAVGTLSGRPCDECEERWIEVVR